MDTECVFTFRGHDSDLLLKKEAFPDDSGRIEDLIRHLGLKPEHMTKLSGYGVPAFGTFMRSGSRLFKIF